MENTKNRERFERVKKWAIVIGAAAVLLSSCAITFNNVWHSSGVKIDSEQNATQRNDSTQFNAKINAE